MLRKHLLPGSVSALLLVVSFVFYVRAADGQTFTSGSTGADGPLNLPASGDFDPAALGLHPVIENVFNFTTINVASGVTIKLSSKKLSGPIYWLATGDVTIAGTLDLAGENGVNPT